LSPRRRESVGVSEDTATGETGDGHADLPAACNACAGCSPGSSGLCSLVSRMIWKGRAGGPGVAPIPALSPQCVSRDDRTTEAIVDREPPPDLQPLADNARIHSVATLDDQAK